MEYIIHINEDQEVESAVKGNGGKGILKTCTLCDSKLKDKVQTKAHVMACTKATTADCACKLKQLEALNYKVHWQQ